jgi:hypothetical protein
MRAFRHIIAMLLVLVAASCSTDQHTLDLINHAEQIVKEYPDSAYNILSAIDPDRLRTTHDRMHHSLVQCESIYYDNVDIQSDSLTRQLFDYYLDSDLHSERARAMYQHAMVKYCENNNAEAVYAFTEAEKSLNIEDNRHLRGTVNLYMGSAFHHEYCLQNALTYFDKAKEIFDSNNLEYHSIYTLYKKGCTLNALREYDKALECLNIAKDYAISNNLNQFLGEVLSVICMIYRDQSYISECNDILELFEEYNCIEHNEGIYYSFKAITSAYNHHFDDAERYIELAEQLCNGWTQYPLLAKMDYYIYQNNYKDAFFTYRKLVSMQDSQMYEALEQPVLNLQLNILHKDFDLINEQNRHLRSQYIYTSVIVFLIIVFIAIYIRYRYVSYKQEISSYIHTIEDLELINKNIDHSEIMSSTIDRLYHQSLDDISKMCEIYYEHSDSTRITKKIFEHVSGNIELLKNDKCKLTELEEAVNISHNGLMTRLREVITLSEREWRIVLYSCAGFSNRAICLLVDCKAETLPKIKYNIRNSIKETKSPDIELALSLLSSKKR